METVFPIITVEGKPFERGFQYGSLARERIRHCIKAYQEIFHHYAGLKWDQVLAIAKGYVAIVESFSPAIFEEIQGIRSGAELQLEEILALNARNEIMLAANPPHECTTLAASPQGTLSKDVLMGQNWDWMPIFRDSCLILSVRQDKGPNFVTFVEAGGIAKLGFNSSGIGLCANTMLSHKDKRDFEIPYHMICRKILVSENMADAIESITMPARASSANYLIGHEEGEIVDVEVAPGGTKFTRMKYPENGVLGHANHFTTEMDVRDLMKIRYPDTMRRDSRVNELLKIHAGKIDEKIVGEILRDHQDFPTSICRHANSDRVEDGEWETVGSIIMNLRAKKMWITHGPPCQTAYSYLSFHDLLGNP
jgi:isopenicillin-N N-acyltransferase-like protein